MRDLDDNLAMKANRGDARERGKCAREGLLDGLGLDKSLVALDLRLEVLVYSEEVGDRPR